VRPQNKQGRARQVAPILVAGAVEQISDKRTCRPLIPE
jgi:hypothetical protein